ncbi:2,3-diaminopropionate biosynthesis protein SbnB [Lysobacter hankyongensis]|uniref:2,3-diaminopropionate biosynthesis protein SbnB n=1 Tax=Lysobacter hankyongensis TaxID=1176535 RepID=A0ABP9ALP7_9GAMM
MHDNRISLITGESIDRALDGKQRAIIDRIRDAYLAFARGKSCLPHSTFVTFEESSPDRIIALPAYLGGDREVAGIKWISSIPSNDARGLDRASAIIAINDRVTGRVKAVMEGSIISAKRTAASAALAASHLHRDKGVSGVGLVGLGLIGLETVRFLREEFPSIGRIHAHDIDRSRFDRFADTCRRLWPGIEVIFAERAIDALSASTLGILATTAKTPHIESLEGVSDDAVILHLSLRDLAPEIILACNNVADDVDHVCRARTSVHLAFDRVGNTDFIVGLVDAIEDPGSYRKRQAPTIFSPFGLGVLDMALADMVLDEIGTSADAVVEEFYPPHWASRM